MPKLNLQFLSLQRQNKKILLLTISLFFSFFPLKSFSETKPTSSVHKKQKTSLKKSGKKKIAEQKKNTKRLSKGDRRPANAYECRDNFTDKYSPGQVTIGYGCISTGKKILCLKWRAEKNYCDGSKLIRHYCNPDAQEWISTKEIDCPNGCHDSKETADFCHKPKDLNSIKQ